MLIRLVLKHVKALIIKKRRFSLMVQGTTSDAGKSTLVAAFCRMFVKKGFNVLPFKPQNMALNSAVTDDGGEIGRAQALQAQACFVAPCVHMNPVLIKPSSDTQAQIIVQGKPLNDMDAKQFHQYKPKVLNTVISSFNILKQRADIVFIEGAGSPAEINLRKGDIANMGFAEKANCPVIIVADIDKGGVFAHIVGTLSLLSSSEQKRVVGFVINRFRGDIALLQSGLDWLENKTGKPVLAVLPYLHGLHLDSEDAIVSTQNTVQKNKHIIEVCVPVLPRISNHTDFDALRLHPNVNLRFVAISDQIESCDLLILPGSKNVRADLCALLKNKWADKINKHLRYGGKVLGICGGYQMLGRVIQDPEGVEDTPGNIQGFGFFPMETVLETEKTLTNIEGELYLDSKKAMVKGYEIHCGRTFFDEPNNKPFAIVKNKNSTNKKMEGFVGSDNNIIGTYIHGIFDQPDACNLILNWVGDIEQAAIDVYDQRELQLERLSEALSEALDLVKFNKALDAFYSSN